MERFVAIPKSPLPVCRADIIGQDRLCSQVAPFRSVLIMNTAKALTEEPPRSPRDRLGGYALMARMIDKGRADIQGTVGEYH